MTRSWKPAIALWGLLCVAVFVYWPGLQGGFLFDDYPNLETLGTHGGVVDRETFTSFVFGGIAGPSGRPLALLSFLIDDNTWPSQGAWFKSTNLLIHLLCGLLLCWATLLLLRACGFRERGAQWMAVFSSACWLLHPLMVSTTLYVVQRMAQLSTLFIFAGIVAYLHGRSRLVERPRAAYVLMSLAVGLGTVLSVLCKENGALLPLLLIVIEFCIPPDGKTPSRIWRTLFLILPSVALAAYLVSNIDFSVNPWPMRSFNQIERLLSESRILIEYLYRLFVPQIEGRGLFQDGYVISRGWLHPWTTLPSVLAILLLFFTALAMHRRLPLVSLAVLFFFAGQLIESSVIGLELYFEHRNYLSAAFLFLPLAWLLWLLLAKVRRIGVLLIGASCLLMLSFLTWQRAMLWQDSAKLELYWAYANPDSPRAQNSIAGYFVRSGRDQEGIAHLEKSIDRLPNSALLNLAWLLQKVNAAQATIADFERVGERLVNQAVDPQAVVALRKIVDLAVMPKAPKSYEDLTLALLDRMAENSSYMQFPEFRRLLPYLRGRLYFSKLESQSGCEQFTQALPLYNSVLAGLMMVAEAASYRAYSCATALLDSSEEIMGRQSDRALGYSRKMYEDGVLHLRKQIREDAEDWEKKRSEKEKDRLSGILQ